MANGAWDESLLIGIELIDEQHKMLVEKLGDLLEAMENNRGEMEITKTLDFMVDYTGFHFSSEEKHMAEQSYPGLDDQKKLHEGFRKTLGEIVAEYREDGPTRELTDSVNTLLVNWLINHIKGVDMEFAEFLNSKGLLISE